MCRMGQLTCLFIRAGAGIAGALASKLTSSNSGISHPPFKLAILVSGFAMLDPQASFFPPNGGQSPAKTLHVIGNGDVIVSNERSEGLVAKFINPRVEFHEGGHYVPSKSNFRQFFKKIFDAIDTDLSDSEAWREMPPPGNVSSGTSTPTSSGTGIL